MKRSVHVRRSVRGDEVILLNFQTKLHVESIELFKLAKPRIYGWENRERLLSSRLQSVAQFSYTLVCNRYIFSSVRRKFLKFLLKIAYLLTFNI